MEGGQSDSHEREWIERGAQHAAVHRYCSHNQVDGATPDALNLRNAATVENSSAGIDPPPEFRVSAVAKLGRRDSRNVIAMKHRDHRVDGVLEIGVVLVRNKTLAVVFHRTYFVTECKEPVPQLQSLGGRKNGFINEVDQRQKEHYFQQCDHLLLLLDLISISRAIA